MRRAPSGIALALVLLGSACSVLVDFDDLSFSDPQTSGVGGNGGTTSVGGSPPAFVVYVSETTGNDANDGLSPSTPKKSLAAGLGVAHELDGVGDVRVCEGTYASPTVHVDFDVALRGGYDCVRFEPGERDTIVVNDDAPGRERVTLALTGPAVTGATRVEGFILRGAGAGQGDTIAVRVSDLAAPQLSKNRIQGGEGSAMVRAGSIGMFVEGDAAPTILANQIFGGTGVGAGGLHFSVGVWCYSATLELQGNIIDGGLGTGSGDANVASTVGVRADACQVESTRNTISGGSSPHSQGGSRGVFINLGGNTSIQQDRIYALDGDTTVSIRNVFAIEVSGGSSVDVTNSMLMAEVAAIDMDLGPDNPTVAGASISGVASPVLRHNTIFAHCAAGRCFGCTICTDDASQGVTIEDNLLFSLGWDSLRPVQGIVLSETSAISSVRGNAVFGVGDVFVMQGYNAWAYFSDAEADAAVSNVSDNKELKTECLMKPSCVPREFCDDPGVGGCVEQVFVAWSGADDGLSTLQDLGWKLASMAPCALAESAHDTAPQVTVDHYGAPRTPAPSAGAHEYNELCL
ncbi:MAG TPA: hypothetical protein VFB62_01330 [Polyangiaceae bacterium]|nr:hypothetical protein [Polyangiaceae bacterium]